VAGERQEHVVERRPAHGDVFLTLTGRAAEDAEQQEAAA